MLRNCRYYELTPNVTDIAEIAKASEAGGADGISLINNFKAMRIDLRTRTTVTAMKYAGLSGPAIRPIAQRMVNEVFHAVKLPIIGIGGIQSVDDVLEMIGWSNSDRDRFCKPYRSMDNATHNQ